jgi:hypothetical protein
MRVSATTGAGMTEYEHAILFLELLQVANGTMANYMTLVFGMIVTSYLAAHRIDRLMMWVALAIYAMFALGFCNEIFQVYSDFARLGIQLSELGKLPDTDLKWFGPVATGPEFLHVLPHIIRVMTLSAFVGSLIFFFRARKSNLSKKFGPVERSDK